MVEAVVLGIHSLQSGLTERMLMSILYLIWKETELEEL